MFGDNDALTTVQCEPTCTLIDTHAAKVNGEMRPVPPTDFLPRSMPDAGWLVVDLNESGAFVDVRTFSTPHDDYGTSSPAWSATTMFLGNDAGVLMAYQVGAPPPKRCRLKRPPVGVGRPDRLPGRCGVACRSGAFNRRLAGVHLCAVAVALLMLLTCPPLGAHGWPRAMT